MYASHLRRKGKKGIGRKLMEISEPSPAAKLDVVERKGGETYYAFSTRAFCQWGISGGRFAGSAKKANTFSLG